MTKEQMVQTLKHVPEKAEGQVHITAGRVNFREYQVFYFQGSIHSFQANITSITYNNNGN